jgi:hypothetical protein
MLFLPESVYDASASLWRDLEAGKTTDEQAYQRMLQLDPDDHIGMLGLGRLRREAVRTAKGRKQLIDVLKDIENGEDRKRQAGELFFDVARLRAELGLLEY